MIFFLFFGSVCYCWVFKTADVHWQMLRFLLQSSYPCKYYVLILVTTITG